MLGSSKLVPKKPDVTGVLSIVDDMKVVRNQVLYVGDTNVDMQTAVNAGMTGIGAAWGFRSREELLESGASRTIEHPLQLLEELVKRD